MEKVTNQNTYTEPLFYESLAKIFSVLLLLTVVTVWRNFVFCPASLHIYDITISRIDSHNCDSIRRLGFGIIKELKGVWQLNLNPLNNKY